MTDLDTTTAAGIPHVELIGVSKHFGGVQALYDVSVSIAAGSVHALVGENGAGKSTLGKIVGGLYPPDEGTMLVSGREVHYRAPRDAAQDGIVGVAQEIRLLPRRSVLENVFLGVESRRAGMYDHRAMGRRFKELCARSGIQLKPDLMVGDLGIGQQQQVEILHALAREPKLLILDEPTAALARSEVEVLFEIIRKLQGDGTTIVYVSHFLEEVLDICDTITVLRDGRLVRTAPAAEETAPTLIEGMVGRAVGLEFPPKRRVRADAPVVLSASGLCGGKIEDVDLQVRSGEIVGVAGLMGSGRTSLARLLFGADRMSAGTIEIDGKPVKLHSSLDAIRRGVAMVPESRKEQGLVMQRSVRENMALVHGADATRMGVLDPPRERAITTSLMERLSVRGRLGSPVAALSGGNQQKVVLAKWLWRSARVLIVDEPARGIDIAAKLSMYRLIASLAEDGAGVLMVSSDIEEIVGLADRVIVMREGRLVAEMQGDAIDEHRIVLASFGESTTDVTEEQA